MATSRLCAIPDCGKITVKREWCDAHYRRWLAHGDPLGGRKTMNGEPERYFRDVVLAYDGDECLFWPYATRGKGHGTLHVDGKDRAVTRLVCEEEHGPPPTPKHEAAHSCGKGHLSCVTKGHLSWKTHKENKDDEIAHGTRNRGVRNGAAKLTEPEAREILNLKGIEPQRKIAARFRISQSHVSQIHSKIAWGWLEG